MDWLEQELKKTLAPKEPPPDFAARVLRRVEERGAERRRPVSITRHYRWMAAAAALVVLAGSGAAYRYHQGIVAKQQVMQAFRIAAVKVNQIQTRIQGDTQ